MKSIILVLLCLAPYILFAQSKFTIYGNIENSTSASIVTLRYSKDGKNVFDSAKIVNDKFYFTAPFEGISPAYLTLKSCNAGASTQGSIVEELTIYLEPIDIYITAVADSFANATIQGSGLNDLYTEYKALMKPFEKRQTALSTEYKSKTLKERHDDTYLLKLERSGRVLANERLAAKKRFVEMHIDSYIGLVALGQLFVPDESYHDLTFIETAFNRFPASLKSTDYGKRIENKLKSLKNIVVGQLAMDFKQNDVNGKTVKLSDFRGKYVLLDFWASWCEPCRIENRKALKAYHDYKDKGFTILGVSLDNNKDQWLKAIKEDKLSWIQLSDLKGHKNEAKLMYGVNAIPDNFLIDPKGKIIAKHLRGEELYTKLAELLEKDPIN